MLVLRLAIDIRQQTKLNHVKLTHQRQHDGSDNQLLVVTVNRRR